MKAPVLHGRRSMSFEDVPDPVAGDNEVVVEVGFCGICRDRETLRSITFRPGASSYWSACCPPTW